LLKWRKNVSNYLKDLKGVSILKLTSWVRSTNPSTLDVSQDSELVEALRLSEMVQPFTLHPSPYTVNTKPWTLHQPYTQNPHAPVFFFFFINLKPRVERYKGPRRDLCTTLHPAQYAIHPTPYTLHPAPYIIHPTVMHIDTMSRWPCSNVFFFFFFITLEPRVE